MNMHSVTSFINYDFFGILVSNMSMKKVPEIKINKYLSFFRIAQERQKRVYDEIRENAKADFDFFIRLIFSTIIIALGLVINSSSVVIGGMLIAPLVWPILAVALAIVKGRSILLGQAAMAVVKSSLLILLVSIILGLLIPNFSLESQEILSRTQPQLYELFIALASGFIGAFVISYPRLGEAMAGVAVAAALVPPLSTVGLLIADKDLAGAGGAMLLYVSNLIAITVAATVLFFLMRFTGPSTEEAQAVQKSNIRWSLIFLGVILIPLILITSDTVRAQRQHRLVEQVVTAKVDNIDLLSIDSVQEGGVIVIEVTMRSPQNIYTYQVEELTNILSEELGESVLLKISVIPVIEAGKLVPSQDAILNDLQEATNGSFLR